MACKQYADAVRLILCVSLVVHLGTLHLMAFYQYEIVLDRSQGVDTYGLRCLPVNVMACKHYADALRLIPCVSLVVHLGTLHLMAFFASVRLFWTARRVWIQMDCDVFV